MKTTVRIVTLSLALGLAGALASAWGAESVIDLISQGQSALANVKNAQAALQDLTQKNTALQTQGTQIQAENTKLQADIAAFKELSSTFNQKVSDYNAQCKSPKTDAQFKECKAQNTELQQQSESLKTQPAALNAREKTFIVAATAYNQQVKSLPDQMKAAEEKYRVALSYQYAWLDKARDQVAQPAFQPYAKKYNCPNVMKPSKTQDAADAMSDQIIACLKRVVNSN
ncbi:MAG: hypothetical protein KGQ62_07505 [Gammaproteobacteria bacterium]|nr:hypothetical protein [Gammaproteobacteria bacterium]MBU6508989.1 hypothetical protein [Gammaproteobacteria bacterium]MDE1984431.1 hypothetical protein [Gammaproteobacteria bacterium]